MQKAIVFDNESMGTFVASQLCLDRKALLYVEVEGPFGSVKCVKRVEVTYIRVLEVSTCLRMLKLFACESSSRIALQ